MTTPPTRRWLSFSLRTMFVVLTLAAIPLGWLAWQIQIVRERKAVLNELRELRASGKLVFNWAERLVDLEAEIGSIPPFSHLQVSRLRRWLGDQSVFELSIPKEANPKLIYRTEIAFPEAQLLIPRGSFSALAWLDSLHAPIAERKFNSGTIFKTGLIVKKK